MEFLSDWYNGLVKKNEYFVKKERVDALCFPEVPTPVVELIFVTCLILGQPDEVRYLSVEIFERFVRQHFLDVLNRVWDENSGDSFNEKWKTVEKKMYAQTSLRMLSCIQLASKFITHPKVIRPKEIERFLRAEGKNFTLSMIVASEMRVWKTLNLQVNIPTVLTFVDILLEQLKINNSHFTFPPDEIRLKAICFIDITYLHHQEIYRKLFHLSTGRWEPTAMEKKEFLATECNILYRATAILALSICFSSRDLYDTVNNDLSILTHFSQQEIQALVDILSQIVLS